MGARAERELLKSIYRGKKYAKTVDKMSDSQVIAIVLRLKSQGKIK